MVLRKLTAAAEGVDEVGAEAAEALRARGTGPSGDTAPLTLAASTVAVSAASLIVVSLVATAEGLGDGGAHLDFLLWLFGYRVGAVVRGGCAVCLRACLRLLVA